MAGRIHGNRGQIKMDPAGGSTPVEVADMKEWTLEATRDRVDVTCFGDTNKQSVSGLPDYKGKFSGFWNSATSPVLWDAILGDVAVMLNLVPDRNDPTFFFEGLANLDGTINCAADGAVTIEGTWSAQGNWSREPATP